MAWGNTSLIPTLVWCGTWHKIRCTLVFIAMPCLYMSYARQNSTLELISTPNWCGSFSKAPNMSTYQVWKIITHSNQSTLEIVATLGIFGSYQTCALCSISLVKTSNKVQVIESITYWIFNKLFQSINQECKHWIFVSFVLLMLWLKKGWDG